MGSKRFYEHAQKLLGGVKMEVAKRDVTIIYKKLLPPYYLEVIVTGGVASMATVLMNG